MSEKRKDKVYTVTSIQAGKRGFTLPPLPVESGIPMPMVNSPKEKGNKKFKEMETESMGFFSSKTSNDNNSLKAAMNEGLQRPYRFTSERECIDDAIQFLGAFTTINGAPREMMMCHAASSVAGIKNPEIRNCFMGILERCTRLSQNECIRLTAEEKAFLQKNI